MFQKPNSNICKTHMFLVVANEFFFLDISKYHGFRHKTHTQSRKIWIVAFPVTFYLSYKFPLKYPRISPLLMTLRSWIRLLKVRQEMCEDPHVPVVGLNVSSYPTQRPVSCHFPSNSSFTSTYDWYTQTLSHMMDLNQWCGACDVVGFEWNELMCTENVLTWASPLVVALVLVFQAAVSQDTWDKTWSWHNVKTHDEVMLLRDND